MAVDLSTLGGAGAQFFDNNGVPLSGGKLYSYAASTTTPKATFTSSSGNVPHTNPIILDSSGRVPSGGEIWLTSGEPYKFVLETPTSILLGTWDNIYGYTTGTADASSEVQTATAGQTLFVLNSMAYAPGTNTLAVYIDGVNQVVNNSYIETNNTSVTFVSGLHEGAVVKFSKINIGATDANVVSYEPGFLGSVATTVADKLQQYISVKDFGALCNGTADDAGAIQDAIDYANSIGGAVVTADGTCKVGTTVTVTAGVKFVFNKLIPASASTDVLRIYGGTTVTGKVDTSAYPTYSGNAVIIDGNGENVGSPFRLHIQTDLDLVVNGGGSTGTAVYFKATDTIARIMNVNLQAEINNFRYGVRMEQTSVDLSKFITSNTMQISTSDTLTSLSMASSHPNHYGLDGNNISIKSQPKPATTYPMFDICGQANIFDLIPWDWDSVAGTAPYAMEIQQYTRNSEITWRTDFAYINNSSADLSIVFMLLFDNGGPRFPRIFTSRTDNTLPIPSTNIVLDNNRFYAVKTTTNVDAPIIGITSADDLLLQAAPIAGSDIAMDTRNATGIYAFRIDGSNKFFISSTNIAPGADNAISNGTGGQRWSVVYAATGTINTSDARNKQDVAELTAAEKRVALALKGLIRKFRFKDAVAKKGRAARIHTGVLAQEVEAAFAAEGLDAFRYGLLCYDELDEGDIYGVRYDELVMFILGAI